MNTQAQQVTTLRELIMAKQAFDRSLFEFLNTMPGSKDDARVALMIQQLPDTDPRETNVQTLDQVLTWLNA